VGLDPSRTWKGPIGTMSSPSNGRIITCPSDEGVPNVIKQQTKISELKTVFKKWLFNI